MATLIIPLLMLLTIVIKAFADVNEERYKSTKKKIYGTLYHGFYLVLIFASAMVGAYVNKYVAMFTECFQFDKLMFSILTFALIYFACFDWLYNLLNSNDPIYVGKVSAVDRAVRFILGELPYPAAIVLYQILKIGSFILSFFVANWCVNV